MHLRARVIKIYGLNYVCFDLYLQELIHHPKILWPRTPVHQVDSVMFPTVKQSKYWLSLLTQRFQRLWRQTNRMVWFIYILTKALMLLQSLFKPSSARRMRTTLEWACTYRLTWVKPSTYQIKAWKTVKTWCIPLGQSSNSFPKFLDVLDTLP